MPTATLKVRIQPASDALHRVVCVCHRRGLEIVALSYADREIALTITGEDDRLRHLDRWLGALHDVLLVCDVDPAVPMALGG